MNNDFDSFKGKLFFLLEKYDIFSSYYEQTLTKKSEEIPELKELLSSLFNYISYFDEMLLYAEKDTQKWHNFLVWRFYANLLGGYFAYKIIPEEEVRDFTGENTMAGEETLRRDGSIAGVLLSYMKEIRVLEEKIRGYL